MGIKFTVDERGGYYEAKFLKDCSDEDLLTVYKSFIQGDKWQPGLNELIDISDLTSHDLGAPGLFNLARYLNSTWKKHAVDPKLAIYIPIKLHKNTSILFYIYSEFFGQVKIFRDKLEAISWLLAD